MWRRALGGQKAERKAAASAEIWVDPLRIPLAMASHAFKVAFLIALAAGASALPIPKARAAGCRRRLATAAAASPRARRR
jgi:hypothetical protein